MNEVRPTRRYDSCINPESYKSINTNPYRTQSLSDARLPGSESGKQCHWSELDNLVSGYAETGEWALIVDVSRPVVDQIRHELDWTSHMMHVYITYIFSLYALRRSRDALNVCKEVLRRYPSNLDLKMLEGDASYALGDYRQALRSFEMCQAWRVDEKKRPEGTRQADLTRTARKLAWTWLRLGDVLSAREWFLQAYHENPGQAGVIPMIALLTSDRELLVDIERTVHDPDRYGEFVESYAMCGFDDALHYVQNAEARWGESEATNRARFVWAVREGSLSASLTGKNDALQEVRLGLWFYEQGEKDRALSCWVRAGHVGEPLVQVSTAEGGHRPWQMKALLKDFIASHAIQFLTDFGAFLTDFRDVMPVLLETKLIAAFATDAYLNKVSVHSCEEQEWKAMVYLTRGDRVKAQQALSKALAPDGYPTVRGYWLQGKISADNSRNILLEARTLYPFSTLLSSWEHGTRQQLK